MRVSTGLAITLLALTLPGIAGASPAEGLQPGQPLLVLEGGTRLRAAPNLRADVVTPLEEGRWLELRSVGETATVGGQEAPWLEVYDPWAPMGDGLLAGPWEGWVWGGLVAPAPETVPQVTHALWDRVFAAATEQVGPKMWALRPAADQPGVVELGEWTGPSEAPDRVRPLTGWQAIDAVHRRDPGNGRAWLWIVGRASAGHLRGQLVSTASDADPLEVMLSGEPGPGRWQRGSLYLVDLDGDGLDEAIVQLVHTDANGEVTERRFVPFELADDGSVRPAPGEQVRDALLPPPDLEVRRVGLESDGAETSVVVALANRGARSEPTRLDVTVAPRGPGDEQRLRLDLPAMAPGEEREVTLPVTLPRLVRDLLIDAVVVPVGVEVDLGNNRLARWTAPDETIRR